MADRPESWTTAVPEPDRRGCGALSNTERIREAALKSFAQHGTSATTLRSVAAAAGVSLGLLQHHFATNAGLVDAVDDHVTKSLITSMSQPIAEPPGDSISEVGSRVTRMIADQPEMLAYVGRAVVDGSALGAPIRHPDDRRHHPMAAKRGTR